MSTVRTLMSRDLLTVEPTVSMVEVARRMVARNVGAVLVLDSDRLSGIVTERDVMRAVARGAVADSVAGDLMTANPETIEPDATVAHAAVLMLHGGYRHLPVTEGDEVIGMLSVRDLIPAAFEDSAPRGV